MKQWHMLVCAALVIGGVGLAIAGVSGVVALLPLLGCMVMMGAMFLMMRQGS